MMEIVTVWLLYTVTILIKYRHYFVEENLLVKYPSVSLSFMIPKIRKQSQWQSQLQ